MRRSVAPIVVLAMVVLGGMTSGSEARPLRRFESSGPASVPDPTEVVYSNFGPDMAFDSNPNHGWGINGYQGPNIGRGAISQQFTPSADYTFGNAQVAVSLLQGPNSLHVFLQADSSGLPGAVIEEITMSGLGSTPAVVTATSALAPLLDKDTPYWLTLVAEDDYVKAGWNWNSVGDASATTFAGTQGGSAAGPWSVGWLATRCAFQINGTPLNGTSPTATPQPTSTPPTPEPQPTSTPPTPGLQSTIYLPLIMGPPYYRIAFERSESVYVMNADGSNQTYLGGGANPVWAPDGRRIAVDGIDVVNVDGSNRTRLQDGGDPNWSPDGSRITFLNAGQIYTMRADGSDVVAVIKHSNGNIGSPVWSPNGWWIAFVYGENLYYYGYDICVKRANGTGSTLCITRTLSDGDEYSPVWSPDARWIAFTSSYPFYAGGSIWIVHPDGTKLTRLTAGHGPPAWSPDGRWIAFEESGDIYAINVDGSGLTNLTTNPADDTNPAWSPDGRWIAFERYGSIYVMKTDGSNQTYLAGGVAPVWSPTMN